MEPIRTIRPLQDNSGGPARKRMALLDDREAKELTSTEEIELFFKGQRFGAIAKRKAAQLVLDSLSRLLLEGAITGLQLVRLEREAEEIVKKQTYRLMMLRQHEELAERQRRKEGSAWV